MEGLCRETTAAAATAGVELLNHSEETQVGHIIYTVNAHKSVSVGYNLIKIRRKYFYSFLIRQNELFSVFITALTIVLIWLLKRPFLVLLHINPSINTIFAHALWMHPDYNK